MVERGPEKAGVGGSIPSLGISRALEGTRLSERGRSWIFSQKFGFKVIVLLYFAA